MTKNKFEALVEKAATHKLNFILPNSEAEKSAFVMVNIFNTAERHIKLLVNNLDSQITNTPGYDDALENAIKRGVKVSILYRQEPNHNSSTNKLLDSLVKTGLKNIQRKTMNDFASSKLESYKINHGENYFFAESDNRMYRFEFDKINHKAWFNFNDEKKSKKLSDIFDSVYSAIS